MSIFTDEQHKMLKKKIKPRFSFDNCGRCGKIILRGTSCPFCKEKPDSPYGKGIKRFIRKEIER